MKLAFTKMQGLGNDFVVLDAIRQSVVLSKQQIQYLADRHYGIGCDQLLILEPATGLEVDFIYRIYNSDGQEVEQCGNGARCVAKFVKQAQLSEKQENKFQTKAGEITTRLCDKEAVAVNMGQPCFVPEQIPLAVEQQRELYAIHYCNQPVSFSALSLGNPHAVIEVNDISQVAVKEQGHFFANHALFPASVNVGFMQIVAYDAIKLRVYERGVGETQACGSGACAAAVAGIRLGKLNNQVKVSLPGGDLMIDWRQDSDIWMQGGAEVVFQGEIHLS